jgi:hypothetical protein
MSNLLDIFRLQPALIRPCRAGTRLALEPPGGEDVRLQEHPVLEFRPGRKVLFTLDGTVLEGYEGEPVAMALEANGIKSLRESPLLGRPRGVFCAQGNCASCLMTVDGRPNVRTCVEKLRAGMRVERQKGKGSLLAKDIEKS